MEVRKTNKLIDGYSLFESNLLYNRGIETAADADYYFNANLDDLGDFWKIKELKEAAYFIKEHIDNNKKIIVFGDYDVDGVTSTDIMVETLQDCGANVSYRMPCRIEEGYGISMKAVREIINNEYDLIITVDNGIRANDEIKFAREHGVDVVVLDHHQIGASMPNANFVVDLHRPDEEYGYTGFAGCGVAFMMARALYSLYDFDDDKCKKHLDVVAIGTIADVMELTGENRILVREGLKVISNMETYNYRPGISQLLSLNYLNDHILSTDIGFKIAPCLNAPGRLLKKGADLALELLLEKNAGKAREMANYLYRVNEVRKEKTKDGLAAGEEYIAQHHIENDNILILCLENLEDGIIGLVSGKITEKYYKPSIVFTKNARGNYKASARSIPTIDLYECLCSCHSLLFKYGGHEQAAGLEILPQNFDALRNGLNMYIEDNYEKDCFVRPEYCEWELTADEINMQLINKLEKFEPCGNGNERPVLYIKDYPLMKRKDGFTKDFVEYSIYGEGDVHISLYGKESEIQGFFMAKEFVQMNYPHNVSCLFSLELSNKMGIRTITLMAKDIGKAIVVEQKIVENKEVKSKIQNLASLL